MSPRYVVRSLLLATFIAPFAAAQGQQGTLAGRVIDSTSAQPVAGALVNVAGTALGTHTNTEGRYTIRGLTPGTVEVRVLRVGYAEQRRTVTVAAGQTTEVDFRVRPMAVMLSPVVTTATGDQRRVEVGNAIAQINAADVVERSAVSNVGDLLTAKAAGVMVIPGTQTGAGIRIRVRGTSSMSLSNNPIYIIDGIRVEGATGSSTVSVGGTTPSRVGDLNPEEIETIEVVRGPSASTLYGTDAANGVIVITTKKGIAGKTQWTYYTEQTAIQDRNDYPTAYRGWRTGTTSTTNSTASNAVQCFLFQVATGACQQDSVTSYNLFNDPEATPFGTGYRQQHGLQLRGGNEQVRFFLHGEWEDEDGVTKVPEFEKRYLAASPRSLTAFQSNPNALTRITGRANLNVALADNLDVAVNAGYTSQDLSLPRSDDSGTAGIAANVLGGPGFKYNRNAAGDTLYGWREFTPRDVYQAETMQGIERLITSTSANWRPLEWLSVRGNFGVDYIGRTDTQLCRFGNCTSSTDREGFKIDNRSSFFVYTFDAGATASRDLSQTLQSETTVGLQYYRNAFNRNGAQSEKLAPGAVSVSAGSVQHGEELTSESRTLGAFIEERLAISDRLFITGAIRSDRNSAFGADFKTVFYPKLAVSWVVSEEPFFRAPGWMNQLRLRTAYGASGVQPGTTDAVPAYSPTAALAEAGEMPGVVFSAVGNRKLKPERSAELEMGIDGTFWDNRLSTELTYYDKHSKDALVSQIIAPSVGAAASRLENVGEVRNWGWEAMIDAQLIQRQSFGWNINLNGSTNSNELVHLGDSLPIVSSSTLRQVEGYPLNGWWARRLVSFEDKDDDGIIEYRADSAQSEITVSAQPQFQGYSAPRNEVALTNSFDFWRSRFRLAAMLDYKGGHKVYNNTERIRCASRNNCSGLVDPNASLYDQARTVMVRQHPSASAAGFFEAADFIRFRELSLSFNAPDEWAGRVFRGRSLTTTLAARNLGILWTKFSGVDPEAFGTTGDAPSSFQAFAPPTYYTLRLTLGF
jgi:TonB-linked SusC/RagA family outer membrane protein